MAYQIDFTAQNYARRALRKTLLRLLLLAVLAGFAWGVYDVYTTYKEPTLNMRLAEYESVAHPIEEMNAAWDAAAKEYGALVRYYRLIWAANPTNFLAARSSSGAPRLKSGLRPQSWKLTTGGNCQLNYRYVFDASDKAEQVKGLEDDIARSVTSIVQVVGGTVSVQGVQHENLLDVDVLNISAKFALPDVKAFPVKERLLADCVAEIAALRKKVQETKLIDADKSKGAPTTAQGLMMAYLPRQFSKDKDTGKVRADFPEMASVLNVSGWFNKANQFILKNRIPGNDRERGEIREVWNKVGDARFPWERFRVLDNPELVTRTKVLGSVSDGVKRFKGFLEKRTADNKKKLEPFIEAYEHGDVFNKPLVESDLKNRVAAAVGISSAYVLFKDESGAEPAILVKDDEKFTFTWVRWTLSLGMGLGRNSEQTQAEVAAASNEPITLERLQDCVRRILSLGPGYALDKVTVNFDEDGNVLSAILEGLLPVKQVVSIKEMKK